jgi:hypothetical protein
MILTGIGQPAQVAQADDIELVLGTDKIDGELFAAGTAISIASALEAKGMKIFNYSTKGGNDNIKRISKKKRAINLGLVTAKDLAKASGKQLKAISGLLAMGKAKGQTVLLIVRNKAPKKVSKGDYAKAVAEVVRVLNSARTAKMVKQKWPSFSPSSGAAEFKAAGVKLHKAAMM